MQTFHTHTTRCKHAIGTDREYVDMAVSQGFSLIGFSDHTPWPFKDEDTRFRYRMKTYELPEYVESVKSLKDEYKDRIDIRLGLECEPNYQFFDWLRETKDKYGIQYLILGNHYPAYDDDVFLGRGCTVENMSFYVESTQKALESGLFMYMAHPDLPFCNYPVFDEHCKKLSHEICTLCKEHGVPIEFNISGDYKRLTGKVKGLGYPTPGFWEIASGYGLDVYIGIDAHSPDRINAKQFTDAAEHVRSLGLKVLNA